MSKVKEFVGLYAELVEEFKAQNLNEWATPDVLQRMATSLFIEANPKEYGRGKSPPATKAPAGPAKTVTGTLEQKDIKPTSNGGNKYAVKIDGQWYSTFDTKAFGGKVFNVGDTVRASIVQKGQYWNLVSLEPVAANEPDLEPDAQDIPF